MHEIGLAKSLLRTIQAELTKHAYKKLLKVRIGVGALAGIESDHLLDHLREAARGSALEGATLEAVEIPPQFNCRDCGQTISEKVVHTRCPRCRSENFELVRGMELTVLSVDVE